MLMVSITPTLGFTLLKTIEMVVIIQSTVTCMNRVLRMVSFHFYCSMCGKLVYVMDVMGVMDKQWITAEQSSY